MKIKIRREYEWSTVRFLIPAIAIRGFIGGGGEIVLAFWAWRIQIYFPNTAVCGPKPSAGLGTQDGLVGGTIGEQP